MKLDELPKEILERIVDFVCYLEMGRPDFRRADWQRLQRREAEQKALLRLARISKMFYNLTIPLLYCRPYQIYSESDDPSSPSPLLKTLRENSKLAALVDEVMLSDGDIDKLGLPGFVETLSGLPNLEHLRFSVMHAHVNKWIQLNGLLREKQLFRKLTLMGHMISMVIHHPGEFLNSFSKLIEGFQLDCLTIYGGFYFSEARARYGEGLAEWQRGEGLAPLSTAIAALGSAARLKHLVLNDCHISGAHLKSFLRNSSGPLEGLCLRYVELDNPDVTDYFSAGENIRIFSLDQSTLDHLGPIPSLPPKCSTLIINATNPRLSFLAKFCNLLSSLISSDTYGSQLEVIEYKELGRHVAGLEVKDYTKAAEMCDTLCRKFGIRQVPATGFAHRARQMEVEIQEFRELKADDIAKGITCWPPTPEKSGEFFY